MLISTERTTAAAAAILLAALTAIGCSSSPVGRTVKAADYGERWPLTVDQGRLECQGGSVLFTAGSTTYAVNGTAIGQKRWPDVSLITRRQNLDSGRGIVVINASVSPLIDDGRKLCASR